VEGIRDRLKYQLTIRLFLEDKSFGPGPMRLLEGVERTGSLNQAAGEMGMAYSKAWKLIHELEKEWGFALIVTRAGGSHGGGSHLTEEGRDLLERYRSMLAEVSRAADTAFEKYFPE
jgi:molybdate transport repressor ModE-like protein